MRILVAPDKFKGCLDAAAVAAEIAAGLRDVLPEAQITIMPVADGGEGTTKAICAATNGEWHSCDVHDAMGTLVTARYCTTSGGERAVCEVSEAIGLWRVATTARDVDIASSAGVGEMLAQIATRAVREIIVGLGGSATNDGGFGMARALGFRFLDSTGRELANRVSALPQLARIEAPSALRLPRIIAAADARNPLLGPGGATKVFATQKGARDDELDILERSLARLAEIVASDLGADAADEPGAGAAGGLGFGLASFCGARLESGSGVVAGAIGLTGAIAAADIVITGEGRLDAQTREGKAPAAVALFARVARKPVFAIVGSEDEGGELFDGVFSLVSATTPAAEAIARAPELLRARGAELARRIG